MIRRIGSGIVALRDAEWLSIGIVVLVVALPCRSAELQSGFTVGAIVVNTCALALTAQTPPEILSHCRVAQPSTVRFERHGTGPMRGCESFDRE